MSNNKLSNDYVAGGNPGTHNLGGTNQTNDMYNNNNQQN